MPFWVPVILYVGYLGFSLAVATGTIFDRPRTWLKSFTHPYNPLRALGHLWSCPMCIGFWVGFVGLWPLYSITEYGSLYWINEDANGWLLLAVHVSSGGIVSLASYIADVVLRWVETVVAGKEQENEFFRKQLARVHDKAPAGPKADMAPEGRPPVEEPEGNQGAG